MKKEKTCRMLDELGRLVSKARPGLPKKINSFRPSREGLTLGLWGMLASMMRCNCAMVGSKPPKSKEIADLLKPFAHHILNQGYQLEDLKILETFLVGKRRQLPFGTIVVNAAGIATLIAVKPIKTPTRPKGWQPAKPVKQSIIDAINREANELQKKLEEGED